MLRFVIGGILVASIPLIAKRTSPEVAGIVALVPIVTISGMIFLWIQSGNRAVGQAALAGAITVPAVLVYLLTLWFCLHSELNFPIAIVLATASWIVLALVANVVVKRIL